MNGRSRYIEAEPCSVGCDTVIALLERIGWEMSADLIRHISAKDTERNREADRWRREYVRVLERLHKYEPPAAEPARVSAKPDWTCDG